MPRKTIPAPMTDGEQVNNLPVSIAITVPSTDGDETLSEKDFNERVEEARKFMSGTFGGDTTIHAGGGWIDEEGNLIDEDVAVVESFMSIDSYMDHRKEFADYIRDSHEAWGQSQIGYRVEDRMFLYPQRDWADDGRVIPADLIQVQ